MEDNGWTIANQADRLTSGNQYGLFGGVKKSKTRNKSGFVLIKIVNVSGHAGKSVWIV